MEKFARGRLLNLRNHLNSSDSLICRSWFCPSLFFFIHGGFDAYRRSSERLPFLHITIYAKDEQCSSIAGINELIQIARPCAAIISSCHNTHRQKWQRIKQKYISTARSSKITLRQSQQQCRNPAARTEIACKITKRTGKGESSITHNDIIEYATA